MVYGTLYHMVLFSVIINHMDKRMNTTLLSLLLGAVLGLFYGVLFGQILERRRWHDYHRAVMAGLQAHVVGAPPPEDNRDYLDFEQINEELKKGTQ